jgi:dihydrofolate synthase/folylpolyglutamate synthase
MGSAEGLAWLFSLADQERGVGWNPRASPESQWKLGRTRALLDLDGAPDRQVRIALVAGTKGKGSTCAMLASVLGAAGRRCGLYTQPHLQDYRERIRIDGQAIAPDAFEAGLARMRTLVERLATVHPEAGEPTTFEVTTALALDVFVRAGCPLAVVEVGLGGRLDATNATEPELSIITSISYDHTAILGRTLGQIATEKAGILRPGRPALLAEQRPAAARALARACRQTGAGCQTVLPLAADAWPLALVGSPQRQNAALAVAAARRLADPPEDAIRHGLERLRWPGRFEVLAGPPPLVLDGAHNGASATALASTLADYAVTRPIMLVVGINRDKDARAVLRPLLAHASAAWATQTHDNPRALAAADLARHGRRLGAKITVEPDLGRAIAAACQTARTMDGVVCVTGSLLLVGQARATLGLDVPERLW